MASQTTSDGVPNVGAILKQLRSRRGESLREVAHGTGLSASFLSMVERGECDITLGRLGAIAKHYGHDVASLLGYSVRGARIQVVDRKQRVPVNRGSGVEYEAIHVPATDMELIVATFQPNSGFRDELTHEGIDIVLVLEGTVVVTINDADTTITEGDVAVWSGAYRHRLRNDSEHPAKVFAVVTEQIY